MWDTWGGSRNLLAKSWTSFMTLRPDETIQKALLSTPSRFVGEFEAEGILLTHAWPGFHDRSASIRWQEGPASRSAYIFAFRTEVAEKSQGKKLPDYSPTGDIIAAYLSVLFGKRFDSHGLIEGTGHYHTPEFSQFGTLVNSSLPQNSHRSRPDFGIPLNLSEAARLAPLLWGDSLPIDFVHAFQKLCVKFNEDHACAGCNEDGVASNGSWQHR
jgi:hypothetical protein